MSDVERYVRDALAPVMRGAHDWQQHSERYRAEYLAIPPEDLDAATGAAPAAAPAPAPVRSLPTPSGRPHVVLVGTGYTSVWAHRALRRRLGGSVDVTVIAPEASHAFHGFVGEVLAGDLPTGVTRSPFAEAFPGARHVAGWVRQVVADARTVLVDTPDGTVSVPYDELVLASGASDRPAAEDDDGSGWCLRGPDDVAGLLAQAGRRGGRRPEPAAASGRRRWRPGGRRGRRGPGPPPGGRTPTRRDAGRRPRRGRRRAWRTRRAWCSRLAPGCRTWVSTSSPAAASSPCDATTWCSTTAPAWRPT
nr:hypothetical protein [Angustibacter aerolatus]